MVARIQPCCLASLEDHTGEFMTEYQGFTNGKSPVRDVNVGPAQSRDSYADTNVVLIRASGISHCVYSNTPRTPNQSFHLFALSQGSSRIGRLRVPAYCAADQPVAPGFTAPPDVRCPPIVDIGCGRLDRPNGAAECRRCEGRNGRFPFIADIPSSNLSGPRNGE